MNRRPVLAENRMRPPSSLVVAVGFGAIVLWSGTAIANKVAVDQMDAMTAGVLRSMLAALLASGFALASRLPLPSRRGHLGLLLLSGVASFAIWPMLLSLGLGRTSASHAALIMAVLPVFTGLVGAALEGRRLRRGWWAGSSIAVAGTALLVLYRSGGTLRDGTGSLGGDLIILAGVGICALGYAAGARLSPVIGTWATTFWGLTAALTLLIPAFLLLAHRTDWSAVGPRGWGSIAYMTLLSSLVGYAAWFWALGRGGIARISSLQFLQPVFSLLLAAALLGEVLTLPLILSATTILVGTGLAQRKADGA